MYGRFYCQPNEILARPDVIIYCLGIKIPIHIGTVTLTVSSSSKRSGIGSSDDRLNFDAGILSKMSKIARLGGKMLQVTENIARTLYMFVLSRRAYHIPVKCG